MAFEKICCSNKTCKAEENLYGIILAGDAGRKFVYVEPPKIAADGSDPDAQFIDGQSLFELTLRRTNKALSPKRLFVLVNREHLDGDEVRAQLNERAQPSLVWQPRCSDTLPCHRRSRSEQFVAKKVARPRGFLQCNTHLVMTGVRRELFQ
jgi:mannose-1-phosphate guanylyltransferase